MTHVEHASSVPVRDPDTNHFPPRVGASPPDRGVARPRSRRLRAQNGWLCLDPVSRARTMFLDRRPCGVRRDARQPVGNRARGAFG